MCLRLSVPPSLIAAGLLLSLLGVVIAFVGVALSISLLVAKTVSQPPGIAITDPNKIIRALDVFVLLVNYSLLVAHFIGLGASFWLRFQAERARRDFARIQETRQTASASQEFPKVAGS